MPFYFFPIPVLFALINPTFLPGGAFLFGVFGLPICLPLPEPNGWSTAFIATADVSGYNLPLALIACHFFPALTNGFSLLPPPEITPIVALQPGFNVTCFFEGKITITPSSFFPTILSNVPEALANLPPSPG